MYSKYSLKFVFFALFYAFIVLIIAALLIQIAHAVPPCPLCIVQRYALIVGAAASLFGGMHDSRGFMRRIYAGIAGLASLLGLAAGLYQIRMLNGGQDAHVQQIQEWINAIPLSHALPGLLRGTGNCSDDVFLFLGGSLAHWTLPCFALLSLFCGWQTLRRTPERRRFS